MIIRLTEKLGKKTGIKPTGYLPLHKNPFADWSSNLFYINRLQYILFTNTASLYSMIFPGKGIKNGKELMTIVYYTMEEVMKTDGLQEAFHHYVKPYSDEISYAKALNRGVTGSMNDLIYLSKGYLSECDLTITETISRINGTPMSILNYDSPRMAIRNLV